MNIRLEEERDWYEVENLTREAFWNKYRPGCSEHLVLHQFRKDPDFVKELDYVIEEDGKIMAHMMYSRGEIQLDAGGSFPILVFGPISVRPDLQKKGYGSKIIRYTMEKAAQLGYGAIAITGDPAYYQRFGFVSGSSRHIYYAMASREEEASFFMVKELKPDYLSGVVGTHQEPAGYEVSDEAVEAFDRHFPPKEKMHLPGQLV